MWKSFLNKFTTCIENDIESQYQSDSSECSETPLSEIVITEVIESNKHRDYAISPINKIITAQQYIYKYKQTATIDNLYNFLHIITELGFYPPGLSMTESEVLVLLNNKYSNLLRVDTYNIIRKVHRFLGFNPKNIKFSLIVRDVDNLSDEGKIISEGVDENGQSLLHHCIKHKNISLLVHLLKKGCDPNRKDKFGKTPLFYTFGKMHSDGLAVTALIKHGADPNIKNNNGETYLQRAEIKHNKNNLVIIKNAAST